MSHRDESGGEHGGWFYISFADPNRPKGTQFLGGCYVRAMRDAETEAKAMLFAAERRSDGTTLDEPEVLMALALAQATRLGINPGGEAQIIGPATDEQIDALIPPNDRERLLTREEIESHG